MFEHSKIDNFSWKRKTILTNFNCFHYETAQRSSKHLLFKQIWQLFYRSYIVEITKDSTMVA